MSKNTELTQIQSRLFINSFLETIKDNVISGDEVKIAKFGRFAKVHVDEHTEIDPDTDIAVLTCTGGTTGIPKIVMLSHRNLVANAKQIGYLFLKQKPEGEDQFVLGHGTGLIGILPLFHLYGLGAIMNVAVGMGGIQILFPRPPPPEELLKTIYKLPNYNKFVHYTVEYMLVQMLEVNPRLVKKYPLTGRIALCGTGGGYLHPHIRDGFEW